jgi:hypothetical protein
MAADGDVSFLAPFGTIRVKILSRFSQLSKANAPTLLPHSGQTFPRSLILVYDSEMTFVFVTFVPNQYIPSHTRIGRYRT